MFQQERQNKTFKQIVRKDYPDKNDKQEKLENSERPEGLERHEWIAPPKVLYEFYPGHERERPDADHQL